MQAFRASHPCFLQKFLAGKKLDENARQKKLNFKDH
jgi:hypothetical protein